MDSFLSKILHLFFIAKWTDISETHLRDNAYNKFMFFSVFTDITIFTVEARGVYEKARIVPLRTTV